MLIDFTFLPRKSSPLVLIELEQVHQIHGDCVVLINSMSNIGRKQFHGRKKSKTKFNFSESVHDNTTTNIRSTIQNTHKIQIHPHNSVRSVCTVLFRDGNGFES